MAGTITYDVDGSRYEAGERGNTWSRRYFIEGLEQQTIPALIDEAFALIPDTGTPAPAPIGNMYVRSASIDLLVPDTNAPGPPQLFIAKGTITYSTPTSVGGGGGGGLGIPDDNGSGITLSGSSAVQEVDVLTDVNGDEITTIYDNALQRHRVTSFDTAGTLTFNRLESTNPRTRVDTHVGTLNSAPWNGYADKTVLCTEISYETDDNGASYLVTYAFSFRPTWEYLAVHDDPFFPGNPLPGANTTDGSATVVDIIPTSNFALMNITLP